VLAPTAAATVLVVEDDLALRDLYRTALKAAGHRVIIASDGMGALGLIELERPGVVVLDLDLPLVNGWDVFRDLRSRPATAKLPVIVVSGHDLDGIKPQELASFLPKPVDPSVVVDAVDRALSRR
jgi:chemosensory pili system protein ChpA (sensor histidine kinase/response regulator)